MSADSPWSSALGPDPGGERGVSGTGSGQEGSSKVPRPWARTQEQGRAGVLCLQDGVE